MVPILHCDHGTERRVHEPVGIVASLFEIAAGRMDVCKVLLVGHHIGGCLFWLCIWFRGVSAFLLVLLVLIGLVVVLVLVLVSQHSLCLTDSLLLTVSGSWISRMDRL